MAAGDDPAAKTTRRGPGTASRLTHRCSTLHAQLRWLQALSVDVVRGVADGIRWVIGFLLETWRSLIDLSWSYDALKCTRVLFVMFILACFVNCGVMMLRATATSVVEASQPAAEDCDGLRVLWRSLLKSGAPPGRMRDDLMGEGSLWGPQAAAS
jgi:hypothetical protein